MRAVFICRQDSPHCASVSFDRHAANVFQQYINGGLAFSIKRGALLYGEMTEGGNAMVHAIYEPPQVLIQLLKTDMPFKRDASGQSK